MLQPSNVQMIRAARALIEVHGPHAAAVAEKRAARLDECGEMATAITWRLIGDAVREIEARLSPHPSNPARSVMPRGDTFPEPV